MALFSICIHDIWNIWKAAAKIIVICKNTYSDSLFFAKDSIADFSQGYEYTKILNMSVVLNIPGLWICLWFWIFQGSKYQGSDACGSEYAKALNMPGFRIYQGSKYAPGSEYDRVLNIPLVLNMTGSWIFL